MVADKVVESNVVAQRAASALALAGGLGLVWAFKGAASPSNWSTTEGAAFWLGMLLLLLGVGMLLTGGRQVVQANARTRTLTCRKMALWRPQTRAYPFADIVAFAVEEWGDDEGGRKAYDVLMTLRNGHRVSLFAGFFDGRHDRAVMQRHCDELNALVLRADRAVAR